MSKDRGPILNSYRWLDGRLIAGEYPGDCGDGPARAKLGALLDAGVTCFVDLTEAHELKGLTPSELAARSVDAFLRDNKASASFNQKQRVVLIASSFDPQTQSACAWLAKSGIDIRCIAISPVEYGQQHFFQSEHKALSWSDLSRTPEGCSRFHVPFRRGRSKGCRHRSDGHEIRQQDGALVWRAQSGDRSLTPS